MVLVFAGVRYENSNLNNSTKQFAWIIATINLVIVVKFFEVTYINIFHQLLNNKSYKSGLLGPVSTNFRIVETNGWGILHLWCLVWLQRAYHLSNICEQLKLNAKYTIDIVKFIDRIICFSISEEGSNIIGDEIPSVLSNEIDQESIFKLEWNGNAITAKTQLHFSSDNATCFKYGVVNLKQCQFDFPWPRIVVTVVIKQGTINIH